MLKATLREELLTRRKRLTTNFIQRTSHQITTNLLDFEILKNKFNVLAYLPINGEVDTLVLMDFLRKKKIKVFVPAFVDDAWVISKYAKGDKLEDVFRNVPQPKKIKTADISSLDLIIVPGAAFAEDGARLGMGLGVYDKLLMSSNATKVGLAYEFQIVDKIETETHDVPVDYIVTEKRVLEII